jgi:GT2 family glycosyltransferase
MREPAVEIVVVTSDRTADLRRCLTSLRTHLAAADAPPAAVTTVHPPHDREAMAMVRAEHPWVRVLEAPRRHISEQRNLGARHARAGLLVYLDDDAWPRDGWLAALTGAFADPRVIAASGPVFRGDGSTQCRRLAASRLGRLVPIADDASLPPGMAPSFSGCNLAIRRSALCAAGGFDENLPYQPDDMDVCRRLFARANGDAAAFVFVPGAAVVHESSPGPYRRTLEDRAWFTVARDNVYFACRHAGVVAGTVGGIALQAPKLLRFVAWLLRGRLGPVAFARCIGKHAAGTVAGCWKGLTAAARLPLVGTPDVAAPPAAAASPRTEDAPWQTVPPS